MFSFLSPSQKWIIAGIMLVAIVLRMAAFPHLHEVRDTDEIGYVKGGLATLEGVTPGSKASPGAPIIWLGFLYAGGSAAWHLVRPTPDIAATPIFVRPYMAVEHALFDNYRDPGPMRRFILVILQFVTLGGVLAGALLGAKRAGTWGALLLGGSVACMPMFIEFSPQSRPYAAAWAFVLMAMAAAALAQRRPQRWACFFMGLAIATRVDMVVLVPILLWELHQRRLVPSSWRGMLNALVQIAVVSLVFAPWLTTNMLGNLRTILTVRFFPAPTTETPLTIFLDMIWGNGLGVALLLFLMAWIFLPREGRKGLVAVLGYITLLALTMLRGSGYGLHHHGAEVLAIMLAALVGLAACIRVAPRLASLLVVAGLALTLVQGTREVMAAKALFTGEESAQWIEQHVKPDTPVIMDVGAFFPVRTPVPSRASSDAIWREVTSIEASESKFLSGVKRFALPRSSVPRALSEEDMIQETSNLRGWFIMGSSIEPAVPRFDITLAGTSPVFFLKGDEILDAYHKRGGVLVTGQPDLINALGKPAAQWQSPDGHRIAVFAEPNVLLP